LDDEAAVDFLNTEIRKLIDTAFHAQKSCNLLLETSQGKVIIKGQRGPRDPVRFWLLN
jgi:hypothetical protein